MDDKATELAPTVEVSIPVLTATRALSLIDAAEEVIDDMYHQVEGVEERCAVTRARIAQRHERRE